MNLTSRAARWSAAHRRKAVLGWLAFAFVAFAIASVVGVVKMTTSDGAIGDSGAAGDREREQDAQHDRGCRAQSRHRRRTRGRHRAAQDPFQALPLRGGFTLAELHWLLRA